METNKFELIGRVNFIDFQVKTTGTSYARILVSRKVKEDKYESFPITLFDEKAQELADNVQKGDYIYATGRLSVNTFTSKDGKKVESLQLIGSDFSKVTFDKDKKSFVKAQEEAAEEIPW